MKATLVLAAVSFALAIFLSVPLEARADALDDEAATIQAKIVVLQAELAWIQALKQAGYTSFPVAVAPVTPNSAGAMQFGAIGACSQAQLGACGANASMAGDSAAGRNGPVRRLLGRLFHTRGGSGGCGG